MIDVGNVSLRRGFIRGGNWNNGSNAGAFSLNLNNTPTNTNTNIGFRVARSFRLHQQPVSPVSGRENGGQLRLLPARMMISRSRCPSQGGLGSFDSAAQWLNMTAWGEYSAFARTFAFGDTKVSWIS